MEGTMRWRQEMNALLPFGHIPLLHRDFTIGKAFELAGRAPLTGQFLEWSLTMHLRTY